MSAADWPPPSSPPWDPLGLAVLLLLGLAVLVWGAWGVVETLRGHMHLR